MKKTISIILAVVMLLGCMSVTSFAETPANSTTITATKTTVEPEVPAVVPVTYKMVIPSAVILSESGVKPIGRPSVENVSGNKDDTVITYIATGTQLTSESGETMATTYYSAYTNKGNYTLLTSDPITVFQNNEVDDTRPTLYVGVEKSVWDAAKDGTYTATITFNFAAGSAPCQVAMGDNSRMYRVIRKGDTFVYVEEYWYTTNQEDAEYQGYVYDSSVGAYKRYSKRQKEWGIDLLGENFEVGDCFHAVGYPCAKCINTETHNFGPVGDVLFTVSYITWEGELADALSYCVPSGTICYVKKDNGMLYMRTPGGEDVAIAAGDSSNETLDWYINEMENGKLIERGKTFEIYDSDTIIFKRNALDLD